MDMNQHLALEEEEKERVGFDSYASNDDIRKCWVCRDEEYIPVHEEDQETSDPQWLHPCKCLNSTKWVHKECLNRCIEIDYLKHKEPKCPMCQFPYIFQPVENKCAYFLLTFKNLYARFWPLMAALLLLMHSDWNYNLQFLRSFPSISLIWTFVKLLWQLFNPAPCAFIILLFIRYILMHYYNKLSLKYQELKNETDMAGHYFSDDHWRKRDVIAVLYMQFVVASLLADLLFPTLVTNWKLKYGIILMIASVVTVGEFIIDRFLWFYCKNRKVSNYNKNKEHDN